MAVELSKYCNVLVSVLYGEFLARRAHGVPMEGAVSFSDGVSIQEGFLPSWPLPDVVQACKALRDKGFLSLDEADENVIDISLTDDCIAYMEGRFHHRLELVLAYLEKITDIAVPAASLFLH